MIAKWLGDLVERVRGRAQAPAPAPLADEQATPSEWAEWAAENLSSGAAERLARHAAEEPFR